MDPTPPTHHQRSLNNKQKSLSPSNTLELADNDAEVFDVPLAEALIQNEQTFHHLKILKSSPADEAYERQLAAAAEANLNRKNRPKKVYSQVCGFYVNELERKCTFCVSILFYLSKNL